MILSRRVALNGQNLDEIYGRIVIRSIEFEAPKEDIQTIGKMGGFGQRITSHRYETLDVVVKWAMDVPKTDLIMRRRIYDDVGRWAMQTGWLTVNFMPERRLWVDKTEISPAGDFRDWTGEYTITFRAYSVPFWQDAFPYQITKTSYSGGNLSLPVPGVFRTVAELEFKNTSGSTLDTFSVTAGGHTISLSGLGCGNNSTLKIHHGTDGLLRIQVDSTSKYNNRSASSADDLYVDPGTAAVSITTERSGNLKLWVYGRYA